MVAGAESGTLLSVEGYAARTLNSRAREPFSRTMACYMWVDVAIEYVLFPRGWVASCSFSRMTGSDSCRLRYSNLSARILSADQVGAHCLH